MKRIVPIVLMLALLLALPVSAADGEAYTYTVRIFAGAQGSIAGQDVIVREDLHYGDRVDFNINAVLLDNDSKYYVKGIRESGKDNNTISTNSIFVTGDVDYVVAYGLRGSSVAYTVNYVDEAGNELYPSTIYYGNVGDKPVVSYQYVEGYQPQAYNVTKTLSENAAENVFTFTYTRIEQPAQQQPAQTEQPEETEEEPEDEIAPVRPVEEVPDNPVPQGNPDDGDANGGGENGENGANGGANGGENGPLELEDLDENETPLAGPIAEVFADAAALPVGIKVAISGCVVLLLGLAAWLLLFHKKKKKKNKT